MSKVDALRALREARYAARPTSAPAGAPRTVARVPAAPVGLEPVAGEATTAKATRTAGKTARKPAAGTVSKATSTPSGSEAAAASATCGHRSMNGRTCTRDLGHTEKNHRYG